MRPWFLSLWHCVFRQSSAGFRLWLEMLRHIPKWPLCVLASYPVLCRWVRRAYHLYLFWKTEPRMSTFTNMTNGLEILLTIRVGEWELRVEEMTDEIHKSYVCLFGCRQAGFTLQIGEKHEKHENGWGKILLPKQCCFKIHKSYFEYERMFLMVY